MSQEAVKVPSPCNLMTFITLYTFVVTLRDVTGQQWRCKVAVTPRLSKKLAEPGCDTYIPPPFLTDHVAQRHHEGVQGDEGHGLAGRGDLDS